MSPLQGVVENVLRHIEFASIAFESASADCDERHPIGVPHALGGGFRTRQPDNQSLIVPGCGIRSITAPL